MTQADLLCQAIMLLDDSILHIEHPMGFKGEPVAHELALDTDIGRALQQQLRDVCHNLK